MWELDCTISDFLDSSASWEIYVRHLSTAMLPWRWFMIKCYCVAPLWAIQALCFVDYLKTNWEIYSFYEIHSVTGAADGEICPWVVYSCLITTDICLVECISCVLTLVTLGLNIPPKDNPFLYQVSTMTLLRSSKLYRWLKENSFACFKNYYENVIAKGLN